MLLEGKRILVTGSSTTSSLAFSVARIAQEQGAEVVLSSFGRVMSLTERAAAPTADATPEIVELDVTQPGRPRRAGRQPSAAGSTVCVHSIGVRAASRASAAGSSTRRGRTSPSRCRCRRTR